MTEENIILKKKSWYKKKWFYITVGIVILLVGGMIYGKTKKPTGPTYEFTKVTLGNLKQTVDATGNVEASNEVDLKFATAGRLAKIYKKAGDTVRSGEILASLEINDLNASVSQASAGVKRAEAELKQSQTNSYNSVKVAEAALETAKNNLKLAEGGDNSRIVQDAYEEMVSILQSIQNTLSSSLTEADNILGVDNTLANDDYEDVLSALNSSKKNIADSNYLVAKTAKNDFSKYQDLNFNSPHTQIDLAIIDAENALRKMNEMLISVSGVLDNTLPLGDLSQTELDTLKSNINTAKTDINTKTNSLLTQKQAIQNAKNSYTTYQIAYSKAVEDLEAAKRSSEANIGVYEANLASAQASLQQAAANRDKAIIKAPVSGTIGKITPKVGEYVTSQDDVIKLVSQMYQVKVDIPETDIVKMTVGNVAEIKLDAYGDDVKFVGKVMQIEPGQTVIQDVVYYRVTVSLEPDNIHQIYNGMTANIVFSTEEKTGVLLLPSRSVRTNDDGKYVRVLESGELKEISVKVGLRGDDGLTEIIEGLTEGQEVVVNVTEAK